MPSFFLALVLGLVFAGFPPSSSHGLAQQIDWATMDGVENTQVFPNVFLEFVIQKFQVVDEELDQLRTDNEIILRSNQELKVMIQGLQSVKATLEERVAYLETITRKNVPQTCQDLKKLGVTESGSYLVDPDGAGIGDPPVMAACDFSSEYAATVIQHNVKGVMEVEHCEEPGCHKTTVTYEATDRQIEALKALSVECSQDVQYECFASPLIENTNNMAWWVGNTGEPNYFWDGDHEPSEHVCACDATDSCLNENYRCNCDASAPQWLEDEGVLRSDSLPVTELSFGGLEYDGQQAKFSLGPLKCWGRKEVNPSDSCDTLRMAGHTASGYYFIDGPGGIHYDLVKCNMDAEKTEAGFQSATAVKLAEGHVAFDFVRNTAFSSVNSVVTYESFYLNDGDAMSTAGTFTAPFDGVYAFLFLYDAHGGAGGDIEIRLNQVRVAHAVTHSNSEEYGNGATAILRVLEGQTVDVRLIEATIGGVDKATHFTGFLLYPL